MAKSQATLGKGTLMQRDTVPASGVFTTIAEVLDIKGPKRSKTFEDVTHQESPGDYIEKLPQLKDGGQVTFQCHLLGDDPTQDDTTGLGHDYENDIERGYRIKAKKKDGTFVHRYFAGFVANLEESYPVKGKKTYDVTIEVTGPVTPTAVAA
jgi:hypothetical protein